VTEIHLPSVAGLSVADILRAFIDGAEAVLVVASRQGADRYPKTNGRIRARVDQARALLQEAGVKADRLRLLELA
jgi:coenzyme F420-reducing hydrogenase delta subunit